MRWRSSTSVRPASGFIEPCIPTKALRPPAGDAWLTELKFDGYRLMVRKQEGTVRVYTRRGADWTAHFPRVVSAVRRIKARSVLIDGEGIVYDGKGMPDFTLLHSREYDKEVSLLAFDLLELDGVEIRKLPLMDRKTKLQRLPAVSEVTNAPIAMVPPAFTFTVPANAYVAGSPAAQLSWSTPTMRSVAPSPTSILPVASSCTM
jgi:bifunctional non-homologous end joining protein LigD